MRDAEWQTNFAKKLVKVEATSARHGVCCRCGEHGQWWRTAHRQRWVLFDPETRTIKRRVGFAYLDHQGVHWNHCRREAV